MDLRHLESAGTNYPYTHVQGLYGIPFGLVLTLVGLTNLDDPPVGPWALGAALLVPLAVLAGVSLHYAHRFGRVTPTRSRQTRYLAATAAGFVLFVGVDQLARSVLGRPPEQAVSTTLAAWSLGMLVFYATSAGLRAHHIAVWGSAFVAGILPIWGLGVDRDAVAYFPIGAATLVSGLLDHRLLVRTFRSYQDLNLEDGNGGE
ncbi:hypothetical protein [Streptomyces sp. SID3343]|uniref:hypothetical protein n=1 Tax=Streptomyces sp. SID3343 TaxID=2690260 RepID=UPI00136A54E5|nr:hypothetical protein [Streptomyces sp. SID3343]MYW05123.1 hypothetical protein [Streptomyces sp. SID3343]